MLNNLESPLVENHPLWQGTNGALQLREGTVRPGGGVLSTAPASVPVLTPVTKHLPEKLLWTSDLKFFQQLMLIPLAPPAVCLRAPWLQLLQDCCCLPQTLLPLRGGGRAKSARKAAPRHRKRSPTFVAHPAGILPLLLVPDQTSDTGTQQQGKNTPGVPGLTPRVRGATAGLGIVSAPRGPALPTAAVLGALPEGTASALGRRGARPPLPGTERGAALSRQVPINGVFYLTGEIKSLYRGAKEMSQQLAEGRPASATSIWLRRSASPSRGHALLGRIQHGHRAPGSHPPLLTSGATRGTAAGQH